MKCLLQHVGDYSYWEWTTALHDMAYMTYALLAYGEIVEAKVHKSSLKWDFEWPKSKSTNTSLFFKIILNGDINVIFFNSILKGGLY